MSKLSDSWRSPDWLFDKLNDEHGPFDIDLCATAENSKCDAYYRDYLKAECIEYDVAFMNPPYSNPLPFVKKAWEDSKYCKIVCLLKVDPSTKWWAVFWDYDKEITKTRWVPPGAFPSETIKETEIYNGPKPGCEVYFLPKRVQFDPPIGYTGKVSSPSFPSCVVVMDRRNYLK